MSVGTQRQLVLLRGPDHQTQLLSVQSPRPRGTPEHLSPAAEIHLKMSHLMLDLCLTGGGISAHCRANLLWKWHHTGKSSEVLCWAVNTFDDSESLRWVCTCFRVTTGFWWRFWMKMTTNQTSCWRQFSRSPSVRYNQKNYLHLNQPMSIHHMYIVLTGASGVSSPV